MAISLEVEDPFEELRRIQKFARETVSQGLFSRSYVSVISVASAIVTPVISLVDGVSKKILGIAPIIATLDFFLPLDRFAGQRWFFPPFFFDQFLGWLSFLSQETHDFSPYKYSLNEVFERLKQHNSEFLYCGMGGNNNFSYEIAFNASSVENAFCLPGGKMVVYKGIFDKIVQNAAPQVVRVDFEDGSYAHVPIERIHYQDILAALIGHEMTHAAARHSMLRMVGKIVSSVTLRFALLLYTSHQKVNDSEYQDLLKKAKEETLTEEERVRLKEKEAMFTSYESILKWVEEKLDFLVGLVLSKENEYAADIAGAVMATKAGYHPLGALALQQILSKNEIMGGWLEMFSTHPCGTHRKRVALATAIKLDPTLLRRMSFFSPTGERISYHAIPWRA